MAEEPSCEKCGARSRDAGLRPDPNIEDLWFCASCWEEREKTTRAQEAGLYDAQDEDG